MNLRWVHAVLILLSAALSLLFGIWCLNAYTREHDSAWLLATGAAFVLAVGLVVYDSWFLRKTRSLR